MTRTVHYQYENKDAEGLDFVPWPGELGKRVFANVGKAGWAAWLRRGGREVAPRAYGQDNDVRGWVASAELSALGSPAPIRTLLEAQPRHDHEDPSTGRARCTTSTRTRTPRAWISCPGPASWASACSPTSARPAGRRGWRTRPC